LCKRTHGLRRSQRTMPPAKKDEQSEEIKKRRERRGWGRAAILYPIEKYLQKKDVQDDVDDQGNGSDDDRWLGILCGIESRHHQLHRRQRRQSYGVIEQGSRRQARR